MSTATRLYEKTVLANGVRVVTGEMTGVRSASLIIYIGVGSRAESAADNGVSHFLEHMLFKGTERRPDPITISQEIEGVGGILNASTGRESTSYWCKVPSTHFAAAFDVLGDIVRNSVIDADEFTRERGVIVEEIRSVNDSPEDLVHDVIDDLVWGDQGVGRPIAGTEKSVLGLTRDGMYDFWKRNYSPDRIVVSAAGDVRHEEVVALTEKFFGDLGQTSPDTNERAAYEGTAARVRIVERDTEQAQLVLAMPALPYTTDERYVQSTIEAVLSSGMSSRLFQEIREKRGLVYSVYAYFRPYEDVGQGVFYAGTDPARIEEATRALIGEMRRIRDEVVPAEELERTKELRKGRLLMGLEDSRSVASWIGSQELTYGEIRTPEEVTERIEAVTAAQVQDLSQRLFQRDLLNIALIGPYNDADRLGALAAEL
ncbi:MAG TPA: pitrilysin family protein [Thermomicrobiales bacterium]|nr:pitrilysin family protein [Thermomicrobiales bacterium]